MFRIFAITMTTTGIGLCTTWASAVLRLISRLWLLRHREFATLANGKELLLHLMCDMVIISFYDPRQVVSTHLSHALDSDYKPFHSSGCACALGRVNRYPRVMALKN